VDIFGALPQLVGLIEKGGVIGLLVIFCGVLIWEIRRGRETVNKMREELAKVYGQRDRCRLAFVKCKAACDAAQVKVDLSDISDMLGEGAQP
jgi:hypothetical protein